MKRKTVDRLIYCLIGLAVLFFLYALIADSQAPSSLITYVYDSDWISVRQLQKINKFYDDNRLTYSELIRALFGG